MNRPTRRWGAFAGAAALLALAAGSGCARQTLPTYRSPGASASADRPASRGPDPAPKAAPAARPDTPPPASRKPADPPVQPGAPAAKAKPRPPAAPANPRGPSDDKQAEAGVQARLKAPIRRIIWPNVPWPDALADVAEQGGFSVVAIWPALQAEGLGADRRVTLDARDITPSQALDALMGLVGSGDTAANVPAWYVNGGVVFVTTRIRAAERPIVRTEE